MIARIPLARFLKLWPKPATIAFAISPFAKRPAARDGGDESLAMPPGKSWRVVYSPGLQLSTWMVQRCIVRWLHLHRAKRRGMDMSGSRTIDGVHVCHEQRTSPVLARSRGVLLRHGVPRLYSTEPMSYPPGCGCADATWTRTSVNVSGNCWPAPSSPAGSELQPELRHKTATRIF